MKKTNRYPNGRFLPNPPTTTWSDPDRVENLQHPITVGKLHSIRRPHQLPVYVRAKLMYALKYAPEIETEEDVDTGVEDVQRTLLEDAHVY